MKLTIYHNPACSKSRKTLQLIEEKGIEPTIIDYITAPPDAAAVLRLASMLGMPVADMLRTAEADYEALTAGLSTLDDDALAARIGEFPRVLQRPIVVDDDRGRAVIGRPPENVLALLDAG